MARALRLLALMVFILATAGPMVVAETDSSIRDAILAGARNSRFDPFGLRASRPPPRRTYEPKRRYSDAPRQPSESRRPAETRDAASAPSPTVTGPPQTVAVIGDSLAEALADGLEGLYENRPNIRILRKVRGPSGLVRDDFFDWPKALQEMLEGGEKLDSLVVYIGLNDRQSLKDEAGGHEPLTEPWRQLYAARVDRVVEIAAAKRVPLFWVGLPITRSERLTADATVLNEIFRERTTRGGATFVDIWEAFANEQGQYSSTGPDIDGAVTRLRNPDGIHFTEAGARKLAFFLDRAMQKIIERPQAIEEAAVAAALPDINEQMRRENERARSLGSIGGPIDAAEGLLIPILPVRPVAGEVRRLTVVPLATDARLAERGSGRSDPVADLVFSRGVPPAAKPGRADDFTWGRRN